MLYSRHSITAWRASVRTVEGLPACPDDMAHPKYTALVFGRDCFVSYPCSYASLKSLMMYPAVR